MKHLLPIFGLALGGCQTPPVSEPVATAPVPPPPLVAAPDPAAVEILRRQRQLVDALMSQNEALQAQLREKGKSPAPVPPPVVIEAQPAPTETLPPQPTAEITLLMPNADGVIDLVAAAALAAGEAINPFVLRQPAEADRETVLAVQGVVRGEHPCALVNNTVLAVGDQLHGLRLLRIEADALFFTINEYTLRIPVNGEPVRVRRG